MQAKRRGSLWNGDGSTPRASETSAWCTWRCLTTLIAINPSESEGRRRLDRRLSVGLALDLKPLNKSKLLDVSLAVPVL